MSFNWQNGVTEALNSLSTAKLLRMCFRSFKLSHKSIPIILRHAWNVCSLRGTILTTGIMTLTVVMQLICSRVSCSSCSSPLSAISLSAGCCRLSWLWSSRMVMCLIHWTERERERCARMYQWMKGGDKCGMKTQKCNQTTKCKRAIENKSGGARRKGERE